jgi:hypothetical protein
MWRTVFFEFMRSGSLLIRIRERWGNNNWGLGSVGMVLIVTHKIQMISYHYQVLN